MSETGHHEHSFGFRKLRGIAKRSSKGSLNISDEPSTDTTTISAKKPSSLRRISTESLRLGRHSRSASISSLSEAVHHTSTAEGDEHAPGGFDPYSKVHDIDASKPHGLRKTAKKVLKRAASKLSISSNHSHRKAPSFDESRDATISLEALQSPQDQLSPITFADPDSLPSLKSPTRVGDPLAAKDNLRNEEDQDEEDQDDEQKVSTEGDLSGSADWDYVPADDDSHLPNSTPETTMSVHSSPKPAELKTGSPTLQVPSTRYTIPLQGPTTILSPIIESPLSPVGNDTDLRSGISMQEMVDAFHPAASPTLVHTSIKEGKSSRSTSPSNSQPDVDSSPFPILMSDSVSDIHYSSGTKPQRSKTGSFARRRKVSASKARILVVPKSTKPSGRTHAPRASPPTPYRTFRFAAGSIMVLCIVFCIGVYVGERRARKHIHSQDSSFEISLPAPVKSVETLSAPKRKCLDVGDAFYAGAAVELNECSRVVIQGSIVRQTDWHPQIYLIKFADTGYCVDAGFNASEGSLLEIWPCDITFPGQRWVYTVDNLARLEGTNLCLDATANQLRLGQCESDGRSQRWEMEW